MISLNPSLQSDNTDRPNCTMAGLRYIVLLLYYSVAMTTGYSLSRENVLEQEDKNRIETLCVAGGSPDARRDSNLFTHDRAYIFTEYIFTCPGPLARWVMYAHHPGRFMLGVWRVDKSEQQLQLVGYNEIEVRETGLMVVDVPEDMRIRVKPGDVIGVHYPHGNNESIVAIDHAFNNGTQVIILSGASYLRTGEKYAFLQTGSNNLFVEASVHAHITPEATYQSLIEAGIYGNEFTATPYGSFWTHKCNEEYLEHGWAAEFCQDTGFPGPETVYYRPPDEHHSDKCDNHTELYVVCYKRVQLRHGSSPWEGVPYIYNDDHWGTICDSSNNPKWHIDFAESSWTEALCRELGYYYVADVQYAKDVISGYKTSEPVGMYSPECVNGILSTMSTYCQNGPFCDHSNDFYIKCMPDEGL